MSKPLSIALVGAPNCGKTALFNILTGSKAKIANYPGVTVDKRTGLWLYNEQVNIIDLPGTYSLQATSPDEEVTQKVLQGELDSETKPDVILAVMDATNLRMSLRMLLELKQLGLPIIAALNLSDVAYQRRLKIDINKLITKLGIQIVETVAIHTEGVAKLQQALYEFIQSPLAVTDDNIVKMSSTQIYQQVDNILAEVLISPTILPKWHQRLDSVVLHPIYGLLILFTLLFFMFQAVYSWAGPFMDIIEGSIESFGEVLTQYIPEGLLQSLLVDGVIAGVGGVLVFLPQIMILFLFILVLEDSGYLPRAAFLLDSLLYKVGLSGRTFIPLLSSFACAVPSIMSARTIPNPRERLVTIAIAPLMTCSARLPVYALLIAAVIPNKQVWGMFNLQGLTLFALYVIAIISAVLVALVMKLIAKHQEALKEFPLLMELPTYRRPNVKHITTALLERMKVFLQKAGTIIFALTIILWALVTFPSASDGNIENSFAGIIGGWIEPIFSPLGFNWIICIAMITGLAAREVVVASFGTIYALSAASEEMLEQSLVPLIHDTWTLPTAFAFLTWYIYAPMCLATIAVIKRETKSSTQTALITIYLTGLAYVMALIVYQVMARILL